MDRVSPLANEGRQLGQFAFLLTLDGLLLLLAPTFSLGLLLAE